MLTFVFYICILSCFLYMYPSILSFAQLLADFKLDLICFLYSFSIAPIEKSLLTIRKLYIFDDIQQSQGVKLG